MKYFLRYMLAGLCFMLGACSDKVPVDLDIPDADQYVNIYIPQARSGGEVVETKIYVHDSIQNLIVSACYGGPKYPDKDIKVSFEVDESLVNEYNVLNNKKYLVLPADCYELSSVYTLIHSGKTSSDPIKIAINPFNKLEVPRSYLLPVKISNTDSKITINKDYNIVYFQIKATSNNLFEPIKVLSLTDHENSLFFCHGVNLLQKNPENSLVLYQSDEDGTYFNSTPRIIGTPSAFSGYKQMGHYGNSADIFFGHQSGTSNIDFHYFDGAYNITGQKLNAGAGWVNRFLLPCGDTWYTRCNGQLEWWPLVVTDPATIAWGGPSYVGAVDMDIYVQLMPYQCNSLIGIDANGDMWQMSMSRTVRGEPRKIGSGWNKYIQVFPVGTDLLCLDADGDLWKYAFDPTKMWNLQ